MANPITQAELPEGWQLVPKEPTRAMLDRGYWVKLPVHIGTPSITQMDYVWKAMLAAAPQPPAGETVVTDEMVNRFLSWKLPPDFCPDAGITFKAAYNENSAYGPSRHEPFGTNLLTASQAKAMLEHVLSAGGSNGADRPKIPPFDKDWCERMAKLEGTSSITAGADMRTVEPPAGAICVASGTNNMPDPPLSSEANRLERTVGQYPLDVQVSPYAQDCYAFTKGHHDLDAFAAVAKDEAGPGCAVGQPKHEWWRVIPAPDGDDFSSYNIKAKPGARGAFPVTYADVKPSAD